MKQLSNPAGRTNPKLRFFIPFLGLGLATGMVLVSCDPVSELPNADLGDVRPPSLQVQEIADDGRINLQFDEPVILDSNGPRLALGPDGRGNWPSDTAPKPRLAWKNSSAAIPSDQLELTVSGTMEAGREYAVELAVKDTAGNTLSLVLPFYGPNPRPPRLLVNEVLTKTSTKNRDAIELRVLQGGNLGGVTVFLGIPEDYDASYSFPALEVKTGDYLILHCKPEGKSEEIDENRNPVSEAGLATELARSGGLNSSPAARDFWWREAPGLPDDTGVISLANNPLGRIKDALFYTNKTTVTGKDYRSYGTKKLMDRVERLGAGGFWLAQATPIPVEAGARSTGITATRTLCRDSVGTDTGKASDWHVVPSGKSSLGTTNSDEVLAP